jgi:hypothetical protein
MPVGASVKLALQFNYTGELCVEYNDSKTLELAKEINDFVRSKTTSAVIGAVALEAARATFSLTEFQSQLGPSSASLVPVQSERDCPA